MLAVLFPDPSGDIQLRIPSFRVGSFFPSLLEHRCRVDRALRAVVMAAYVSGVSTRKEDEMVAALGCDSGISTSEISRICQALVVQVQAFLGGPLSSAASPASTSMRRISTAVTSSASRRFPGS